MSSTKTTAGQQDFGKFSDEALCELYQETLKQEIIVELLDRYERYLISLTLPFQQHIDSIEDVKSDLFLHLYQALQHSSPKVFRKWLGRIARNKLCDKARKHKPEIRKTLPDQVIPFDDSWESKFDFRLIQKVIDRLSTDQRTYLEMAFLQGYKQREITRLLKWPEDKARKVRQNAIRNLRKKIIQNRLDYSSY